MLPRESPRRCSPFLHGPLEVLWRPSMVRRSLSFTATCKIVFVFGGSFVALFSTRILGLFSPCLIGLLGARFHSGVCVVWRQCFLADHVASLSWNWVIHRLLGSSLPRSVPLISWGPSFQTERRQPPLWISCGGWRGRVEQWVLISY